MIDLGIEARFGARIRVRAVEFRIARFYLKLEAGDTGGTTEITTRGRR